MKHGDNFQQTINIYTKLLNINIFLQFTAKFMQQFFCTNKMLTKLNSKHPLVNQIQMQKFLFCFPHKAEDW